MSRLMEIGYRIRAEACLPNSDIQIQASEAAILNTAFAEASDWSRKLCAGRSVPVFWWCGEAGSPDTECRLDTEIDGILCMGMNDKELHWAIHIGTQNFMQRSQWKKEREQLLSRLEERKWIEKAKAIICEIHKSSEAEAYEFLRKQAMNERKRLVDVCTSIVKVYQLLHDSKGEGRR